MRRLLGTVLLTGILTTTPALAQSPMTPLYPTGSARPQRPPVGMKEIIPAPSHEPGKPAPPAQASPSSEEPPIATAVIPPPTVEPPPGNAEPKKPTTADAKLEPVPESHQVKHPRRIARRSRYVRRLYVHYSAGWYYENAATRGWGGGQFGPSPYSSNGQ